MMVPITRMSNEERARARVHYQWRNDDGGLPEYLDDCPMADMQMTRPVLFAGDVSLVNCPECLRRRLWERVA